MSRLQSGIAAALILGSALCVSAQTGRWGSGAALIVSYQGVDVLTGDSLLLMDGNWKVRENLSTVQPQVKRDGANTTATYQGKLLGLTKTLEQLPDGVVVTWELDLKPDPRGANVELCVALERAQLDHLPATDKTHDVQRSAEQLQLSSLVGDLSLDVAGSTSPWSFDDLRSLTWAKRFRLRFAPPYDPVKGLKAKAVLRVHATPSSLPAFLPLNVAGAGNRGLRDDVAEDGKGGWTDQGANDLRSLQPGRLEANEIGVPFTVAEPVVVLRGGERPAFPAECAEVPVGAEVRSLYFLQTAAWSVEREAPVAEYVVRYADGKEIAIPVRYGLEVNDWWATRPPSLGRVGWQGPNGEAEVALYVMRWENPQVETPIAGVRMRSTGTACVPIWLAGTAVTADGLTDLQHQELARLFESRPNRSEVDMSQWFPCPIAWNDQIEPGSALDVSFLNDAPAGKHGFLKNSGGHFVFADNPNRPVRFWGTNAALRGPYPEKTDAPGIARVLARQGVNLVRFHLYAVYDDTLIAPDGNLNPVALDKLDFFFAQLKENGAYVYMDLNDGMLFDRLLGHKVADNGKAKLAATFDPELIQATQKLAKLFFTHTNPYTNLRLCDDPAACLYEITNENSLTMDWGGTRERLCEPWLSELEERWHTWLAAHGLPKRDLPDSLPATVEGRRFAAETQKAYLDEMKQYLRDLGVKAPLCGTNITFTLGDLWASADMDYTNDHAYWDHTGALGQFRTYNNRSAVLSPAWQAGTLASFARAKVTGVPTVASEWNYVYPNHHRCEGLPYMAAHCAYQDWDAPLFYCATGSFDSGTWARFHETPGILVHSQQTDPATWGLSQICSLLYRRGDVSVGKRKLVLRYGPNQVWENRSAISRLPFLPALARVETQLATAETKDWPRVAPAAETSAEEMYLDALKRLGDTRSSLDRVVSDTGELRREVREGYFLVDSPRTQIACGRLNRITGPGDSLSSLAISSPNEFATIAVSSLDARPLTTSARLLLVAVGNARNADADIEDFVIKSMGKKGPVMAEPVEAHLTLQRQVAPRLRVFALDSLTGKRRQELPAEQTDTALAFDVGRQFATIYYELTAG